MTLKFIWDWDDAPDVKTAELAATWSRLRIDVDGLVGTLVEEREYSHGVRKSLDVPTYPLAEWLAINWWGLRTSARRSDNAGVSFAGAGAGFPWPDLILRTARGSMWVDVRRRDCDHEFVRFLTEGNAVLEAEESLTEIARFIEATVRRLEEFGIHETLLQDEWSAIRGADSEETEFCLVAAAWGLDPYDIDSGAADLLIAAGEVLGDPALLSELASAVNLQDAVAAAKWFVDAKRDVRLAQSVPGIQGISGWESNQPRPWLLGYRRAVELRSVMGIAPTDGLPIEDLVRVTTASEAPPGSTVALVKIDHGSAGIVLRPKYSPTSSRFAAARALGRMATSPTAGFSVMTQSMAYFDKVERAFAAEVLAPAEGISELTNGDYSDESISAAAQRFSVSPMVIERQVENQLLNV